MTSKNDLDRRSFLKASLIAGGAAVLASAFRSEYGQRNG